MNSIKECLYNMSIQQSVNQLLGAASIAAGLYAHQPNVQKKRADAAEYKSLSEEYDPKTQTTQIGREGVAAEKGLQKAGLSPEEAAYQTIPYHQEDLEKVKRLAELEKDPKKKSELYEAAGYTQGMIEMHNKDYGEYLTKQREVEQKKQATVQAALDEKQKSEQIRAMIEQGAPQIYPKREVIKYGN